MSREKNKKSRNLSRFWKCWGKFEKWKRRKKIVALNNWTSGRNASAPFAKQSSRISKRRERGILGVTRARSIVAIPCPLSLSYIAINYSVRPRDAEMREREREKKHEKRRDDDEEEIITARAGDGGADEYELGAERLMYSGLRGLSFASGRALPFWTLLFGI